MILIVGGSGTLGSLVTTRLLAAGERVRVMSRNPQKAAALKAAGAEVVQGDLLDRRSVVDACAGVDVVVAAAHSILGRGRHASVHVDDAGHRQLIDIAREKRMRHVVYTSVYDHGPAYHAVPFFRIKREVERYLAASGLSHTIVRPTAFMDFHAHVLIGKPVLAKGKVVRFGRGEQPRNFVAADDVAQFIVLAVRDESLAGETVDVGGPENLTHLDVVRLYERIGGRPAKVTRVPIGVARTVSRLVRRAHPGLSQILQASVLAEERAERFDARPLIARFPITLTRLADWVTRHASA
jgi:uncharacterized protein YbjT (DUF2867 family)